MRARTAGALVGIVFGVALSWSGMTSPVVIREALLFEKSYLFLFFASAVLTAYVGQRLLLAAKARAVLTGEPIGWQVTRPQRRHVVGSLIFGLGWGVADVCPGPVATQLGQGIAWSLFTLAGITVGIVLYRRRERVPAEAAEPSAPGPPLAPAGPTRRREASAPRRATAAS